MDFQEHEAEWKLRHKASLPRQKRVSSASSTFWIIFWIMVAIGAAIYSAAHTVPAAELTIFKTVPYRSQIALLTFITVELVIFGAAAGRHTIRWLVYLLAATVLVALAGNISSTMAAVQANSGDVLNYIGGFLLAVMPPFTALAAGEVVHKQLQELSRLRGVAREEYTAAWKVIDAKINSSYTKLQKATPELRSDYGENRSDYDELQNDYSELRSDYVAKPKLRDIATKIRSDGNQNMTTSQLIQNYNVPRGSIAKLRSMLREG